MRPVLMCDTASAARIAPFALFVLVLGVRGALEGSLAQWLYAVQAGLAALVLAYFWPHYRELHGPGSRPGVSALAAGAVVGAAVFVVWIHLELPWLSIPHEAVPPPQLDGAPDWRWVMIRLVGAVLVVPLMEELFWRSWLTRWLIARDFQSITPAAVPLSQVVMASLVFGLAHHLWFAGMLAGLAYTFLYRYWGLWSAVLSHALTNLLLGLWVLNSGQWQFW